MGPKQRSLHAPDAATGLIRALRERAQNVRFARARCPFHRRRPISIPRHAVRPPRPPTPLAVRGRHADGMSGRVGGAGFDVTASHAGTRPAGRYVR